ncbi:hypothetical protein FB446DRAFT_49903 [Lentinula raphanica]|nr:hypothetical protein FB446DRAFT_49903 [Lentinula raphanica]
MKKPMFYTLSMFTAFLVFGAASSITVVSAVPIDIVSGPSLIATSTMASIPSTPTSTSISSAAPTNTLLGNPPEFESRRNAQVATTYSGDSDVLDLPGVTPSQPLERVPVSEHHQRRAPSVREVCVEFQELARRVFVFLILTLLSIH